MKSDFRPDIEGLRALAILPILAFHLDPRLCPGGFIGVDIFFVISGFLITRMILAQGAAFSFRTFYLRRVLRLFPALFVTLLATLGAAWKYLGPLEFVQLAKTALAAGFGVSNIFFFATYDYFQPAGATQPLLHTWSLGLEEQVYLVWPALLLLAVGVRRLALVLAAVGVLSLLLVIVAQPLHPQAAFYLMPFRLFQFAIGAALAVAEPRFPTLPVLSATWIGAAAACGLAASLVLFDGTTPWPGIAALLPSLATAALITAGRAGVWHQLLSVRPLRLMGRISYSLYLVHWPVIVLHRGHTITDAGWFELLKLAAVCLGLAIPLYMLVERPFRLDRNQGVSFLWLRVSAVSAGSKLGGTALLATAVAGFAASTLATNGFPGRLDRARVQLLDKELSFAGDVCDQRHARCTFGAKEAERVVYLIGDSHALNLVHGLDRLFRELNLRGVALDDHGCLFAYGTKRFVNGVADKACMQNVQRAYDYLAAHRHPVILAGDYSGYRNEIAAADAQVAARHDEAQYFAWLSERFEAGLQHLKAGERPFILVKQSYTAGIDLPKCLAQPGADLDKRDVQCPTLTRTQVRQAYAPADAMLDALAVRYPSMVVIDPKAHFCAQEKCTVSGPDGRLYFRDTTHLTNEGSAFLIDQVRDTLVKALRR